MARSLPESIRHCRLGGRELAVRLSRSSRRSVGLRIDADGLAVTLPQRFPLAELDSILHQKAGWILGKLDEMAQRPVAQGLSEGTQVDWLGEPRTVRLGARRASIDADALHVATSDPAQLPQALEKLMRREARDFLGERLSFWAARLNLQVSAFKLSGAGTRWGSCTSQGVVRLNWRLMQAPIPVIDYVVIHELCHLVELNHSDRFWALVASACPDWKAKRDWLKREGPRYFAW